MASLLKVPFKCGSEGCVLGLTYVRYWIHPFQWNYVTLHRYILFPSCRWYLVTTFFQEEWLRNVDARPKQRVVFSSNKVAVTMKYCFSFWSSGSFSCMCSYPFVWLAGKMCTRMCGWPWNRFMKCNEVNHSSVHFHVSLYDSELQFSGRSQYLHYLFSVNTRVGILILATPS